jgi:hypothetical protein
VTVRSGRASGCSDNRGVDPATDASRVGELRPHHPDDLELLVPDGVLPDLLDKERVAIRVIDPSLGLRTGSRRSVLDGTVELEDDGVVIEQGVDPLAPLPRLDPHLLSCRDAEVPKDPGEAGLAR